MPLNENYHWQKLEKGNHFKQGVKHKETVLNVDSK